MDKRVAANIGAAAQLSFEIAFLAVSMGVIYLSVLLIDVY